MSITVAATTDGWLRRVLRFIECGQTLDNCRPQWTRSAITRACYRSRRANGRKVTLRHYLARNVFLLLYEG